MELTPPPPELPTPDTDMNIDGPDAKFSRSSLAPECEYVEASAAGSVVARSAQAPATPSAVARIPLTLEKPARPRRSCRDRIDYDDEAPAFKLPAKKRASASRALSSSSSASTSSATNTLIADCQASVRVIEDDVEEEMNVDVAGVGAELFAATIVFSVPNEYRSQEAQDFAKDDRNRRIKELRAKYPDRYNPDQGILWLPTTKDLEEVPAQPVPRTELCGRKLRLVSKSRPRS